MRIAPFIITLTGSSGCGKTHFTNKIIEFGEKLKSEGIQFVPKRHWKYVTRPYRETEIIEQLIKNKDSDNWTIDVKSVKTIPEDCDFIYRTYGDEYGCKKKDLQKYLNNGESPIIVINDVRVVEELKHKFPNQVLSLFLFREIIPDVKTHQKAGESRGGVSENKIFSRFERAVELYRIFIENIFIFDRVILDLFNNQLSKSSMINNTTN
jgi:guanylate kinase